MGDGARPAPRLGVAEGRPGEQGGIARACRPAPSRRLRRPLRTSPRTSCAWRSCVSCHFPPVTSLPPLPPTTAAACPRFVPCFPTQTAGKRSCHPIIKSFPRGVSQGLPEAHHSEITSLVLCLHLPRSINTDIFTSRQD